MDLTVAICTYNGAERLPILLACLERQNHVENLRWEILVIDNNSSDRTADVVATYGQRWPGHGELNYGFEPRQGVAYARHRAIQLAKSDSLVAFLDDDNLPSDTWVFEAYRFGQEHPRAGAYGGIIEAKLDHEPPAYFNQIKLFFAIYNRGPKPLQYHRSAKPRRIPAGPGCVVRKQAWLDHVPAQLLLAGRDEAGQTMLGSCEDLEAIYYIQNSDWEVWHNPLMVVAHHISSNRLERPYLLRLAYTSGLSSHALRVARLLPSQRVWMPLSIPLYAISDGFKVLTFYLKHRHQFPQNMGHACEFQSRLGRLLSPFLGVHHIS